MMGITMHAAANETDEPRILASALRTARIEPYPAGGGWVVFVIDADARGLYGERAVVLATEAPSMIAKAAALADALS